jgi:anti-sigma factor RsiW
VNCNKVCHLLSAYMDGELLGYEHRLIHHHLQRCTNCQTEYEELLQMKRLLAAMRLEQPTRRLAASIVQRVAAEEDSATFTIGVGDLRIPLPALRGRPAVYSPILGLGVGVAFVGMLLWAHPAAPAGPAANSHRAIDFEPANIAREEPAPRFEELTSGLMPEAAARQAAYEPRYSDRLPNFGGLYRQPNRSRKSYSEVSLFR